MTPKILLPFAGVLAVLGLFYLGLQVDSRELPSPLIDRPAPAFELQSLTEPDRTLTEQDFIGEVALVNVFASWCSSCWAEHSNLVELERRGITIHGLNYRDERPAALRYLRRGGNPYTHIAFDPRGDAGMEWGVYATPETFLLDANGRIRHKHVGPLDAQVIREEFLPRIEQLTAEAAS